MGGERVWWGKIGRLSAGGGTESVITGWGLSRLGLHSPLSSESRVVGGPIVKGKG